MSDRSVVSDTCQACYKNKTSNIFYYIKPPFAMCNDCYFRWDKQSDDWFKTKEAEQYTNYMSSLPYEEWKVKLKEQHPAIRLEPGMYVESDIKIDS